MAATSPSDRTELAAKEVVFEFPSNLAGNANLSVVDLMAQTKPVFSRALTTEYGKGGVDELDKGQGLLHRLFSCHPYRTHACVTVVAGALAAGFLYVVRQRYLRSNQN